MVRVNKEYYFVNIFCGLNLPKSNRVICASNPSTGEELNRGNGY